MTGNTAVEFGVIPVDMDLNQNSLHKTDSIAGNREQRCTGFCSQITAGSHLPVKVPIVRRTIVDVMARRGQVQIVLMYPEDAQEIRWNRDGHPVPSPYLGPKHLRFELDFPDTFDVKLAVTCWAKASFDVLHKGMNREFAIVEGRQQEGADMSESKPMETDKEDANSDCQAEYLQRAQSAPDVIFQATVQATSSASVKDSFVEGRF